MKADKDCQTAPIDFDAYIRRAERARSEAIASLFRRLFSRRRHSLAVVGAAKPC